MNTPKDYLYLTLQRQKSKALASETHKAAARLQVTSTDKGQRSKRNKRRNGIFYAS
jgi:hypothetical protein